MVEKKTGYHGLPREYVLDTISQQRMHESMKDNEWLGRGVYFFQYIAHAKWWISQKRYIGRETAILKASLTYTDKQLLNLDDPEEKRKLEVIFAEVISKRDKNDDPFFLIEKPSKYQKWCFACNTIRKICPEIGIITYTFNFDIDYGQPSVFPGNQRQMCVSDQTIISDIQEVSAC